MIGPGTGVRVYLACGATDMRKGIAGLSALAQDVLRRRCQLNSLAPRKWPVLERQMLAAPFQASKASIR